MEQLQITGGKSLYGEVEIAGAKNAALPILCASLLSAEPLEISNVPDLHDVATLCRLLAQMGVKIERTPHHIYLDAKSLTSTTAPYDLVKTMRASILVLGPLLARFGEARVSLPGGCAIGSRPVEQHIKGLEAMGAKITIEEGYIHAMASRLKGARIVTDMITVTGTENLLMAATLADGQTIIENAAREPEVSNLAYLLNAMGARISGIGSDRLVIDGVTELHGVTAANPAATIIADRIEVGTFLCAVAATSGEVVLKNAYSAVQPFWLDCLDAVIDKLRQAGAEIETHSSYCKIKMNQRARAVSFRTQEFPGFPTDMQAQLMAVNCTAQGSSTMIETIFENRFMHVNELRRLGADIMVDGHAAVCQGVEKLTGAPIMATDLRASASLVIAALCAQGQTKIERIYHLDRGYESMEKKLALLGAQIERV